MGGTWLPVKVIQLAMGTIQGLLARFQDGHPGFDPGLGHTFRFSPQDQPKTLDLGQPKARNGFSTFKIGQEGVDTPSEASVWCRLGSVGGRLGDGQLTELTAN